MSKPTSLPEFGSSDNATLGDNQRIVLMKRVILSELVQHPHVLTDYTQWPVKSGHHPLVQGVLDGKEPLTKRIDAISPALRVFRKDAAIRAAALGLPYKWVAQGLLRGFVYVLVGIAIGYKLAPAPPLVPATLSTMTKGPSGRRPKAGVIERYARWYVRHQVSGIAVNTLAKEYHKTHQKTPHNPDHTWQEDRKTVQHGIKEIDRLLKLTR